MKEFVIVFIILFIFYVVYRIIKYYEKELTKLENRIDKIERYVNNSDLIPFGSATIIIGILEGEFDDYN